MYGFSQRKIICCGISIAVMLFASLYTQASYAESFKEICDARAEKYLQSVVRNAQKQPPEVAQQIIRDAENFVKRKFEELKALSDVPTELMRTETADASLILARLETLKSENNAATIDRAKQFLNHKFAPPTKKELLVTLAVPCHFIVDSSRLLVQQSSPFKQHIVISGSAVSCVITTSNTSPFRSNSKQAMCTV
ncbi:MAG: hypothetical protein ACRC2T_01350, partial [Thermoguttaceae bacterium]